MNRFREKTENLVLEWCRLSQYGSGVIATDEDGKKIETWPRGTPADRIERELASRSFKVWADANYLSSVERGVIAGRLSSLQRAAAPSDCDHYYFVRRGGTCPDCGRQFSGQFQD